MKTATVSALRSRLSDYLNQSEPVLVTQGGQAKAVLLPVSSVEDMERVLMANDRELMTLLEEANRRISRTGGIRHEAFWARVERETRARKPMHKRAVKR